MEGVPVAQPKERVHLRFPAGDLTTKIFRRIGDNSNSQRVVQITGSLFGKPFTLSLEEAHVAFLMKELEKV